MHNSVMLNSEKIHSTLFLWLGIIGLLLFIFYFPLPKYNAFWGLLQDTGHLPLFGVISILLLTIYFRTAQLPDTSQHLMYFASFLSTLFLAALVEIIQGFIPGREASVNDLYLGATGGLAFLLAYSLFDKTLNLTTSALRKIVIATISLTLLLSGIYPLLVLAADYINKRQAFPILLTFEQTWPTPFLKIYVNEHTAGKSPQRTTTLPGYLTFSPDDNASWPFIRIDEVIEDWQAYTSIQFTIISMARVPRPITILLDDQHARHDGQHSQRYNRRITPGLNHIRLPVSPTAPLQSPKAMDLEHMASIWVAFPKPNASPRPAGDILIGEIRLR